MSTNTKQALFSDDEEDAAPKTTTQGELTINQKFADRFEHNEKRKELEKLQAKYGANPELEQEEDYSSSSSEDEDARKLTNKAEQKFQQLLYRIQKQDKTLMKEEGEYFTDSDFEENEDAKVKKDKKITYKDVIRRDALQKLEEGGEADSGSDSEQAAEGADAKNENLFKKGARAKETMAEEQARLKNAFKDAAGSSSRKKKSTTKLEDSSDAESQGNQNYDSDDDILVKKEKTGSESDSSSSNSDDQKIRKDKKKGQLPFENDEDVLAQVYGKGDGNLDKTDLFLRQYVLNEGWKDKTGKGEKLYDHYLQYQQENEKIDVEDEGRDLEMDVFEQKYNFRFEEKNSAYLTTHARDKPADSMRRDDSQRKTERQAAAERKEQDKLKRKEEINKLKALKREEIIEKLKRTEFIAGNFGKNKRLLEKAEKELQTEFIPDLYDKAMDAVFDEKYYHASDDASADLEKDKDINYQLINDDIDVKKIGLDAGEDDEISDLENKEGSEINEKQFIKNQRNKKQKKFEDDMAKSLKKQVDQKEADEGFDTWYACDGCFQAVGSGQYRFDCLTCDNFCFCERCYKQNTKHLHKFKRVKVSGDYRPPENSKELIKKSYMLCTECDDSLIDLSKRVYYCKECSTNPDAGDMIYWCNKCKESTEHEHKRSKLKQLAGAPAEAENNEAEGKEAYLDKLLQEYYDLDCEDIIGGGKVKSRFKYTKVPKDNFGLTEEEILLLEDKQLNKLVSMRTFRPYRNLGDDGQPMSEDKLKKIQPNIHRIRKLKQEYKSELDTKRKLVKENQQLNLQLEKENFLGSKEKQNKAERKKAKHEKNKKNVQFAMLAKRLEKENDDEEKDEEIEEHENREDRKAHRKKQKRMAAYGIKE